MDDALTPRRAARVLVLDETDRILLFHCFDPGRPDHTYWITPGGGIEAGETAAAGAARELAEETGLRVRPAKLGEPVWREVIEFPFNGRWYRQEQEFFMIRAPRWEVDTTGLDEVERGSTDGHRWWTRQELDQTADRYYPSKLPELLSRITKGTPC